MSLNHQLCPLTLPSRISPAVLFNREECLLFVQLFGDCTRREGESKCAAEGQKLKATDARSGHI